MHARRNLRGGRAAAARRPLRDRRRRPRAARARDGAALKALDLEFQATPRRAPWLLAIAFAAAAAASYQVSKPPPTPRPAAVAPRAENAEEIAFARETLSRMSVPWESLFHALERSRTEGVLLLSVEPNSENRTLRLTGEAKSYLAALSYVATLGERETLQNVHLVRHESRGEAVVFAISAAWKDGATPPAQDLR